MAPQESAVNSSNLFIPLIDFSPFQTSSPDQAQAHATAASVLHGFQSAGFIYLKNFSIPASVITHAFSTSAKLFARPQSQKDALGWTSPQSNRGYVTMGREKVSQLAEKAEVQKLRAQVPDLKESFEIGREGVVGLPNRWPPSSSSSSDDDDEEGGGEAADPDAVEFKATMLDFFERCKALHVDVMRAIAVGLSLPRDYFDGYTDGGDNTLRLLHYPPAARSVFAKNKLQVRAGEHSDYGSITLLFQDDRGGLQVRGSDGVFVDAVPIPGTVVVNAGDLLARWANDCVKSTVHRVVEPPVKVKVKALKEENGEEKEEEEEKGEEEEHPARYSMAYFCNPNFDSFIEAIPGTWSAENPKKYEGISSGEYLVQRLSATYS